MFLILVVVCLMVYAGGRAYYVPISADESSSFQTLLTPKGVSVSKWAKDNHTYIMFDLTGVSSLRIANTHYLNSLLMAGCMKVFGYSEFSLRLPNLIALFFFILFTYRITRFIDNKVLSWCFFLLLNLNPFLLDFFSLARGYGLSIALMVASLYYFMSHFSNEERTGSLGRAYLLAMLSVFANFTTFNFYLSLLFIQLAFELKPVEGRIRPLRLIWNENKKIVLANLVFACFMMVFLLLQVRTNQFYIGGDNFRVMFESICFSMVYYNDRLALLCYIAGMSCLLLAVTIVIYYLRKLMKSRDADYRDIPFIVSFICLVLLLVQNKVLKTPLPEGRTSLYLFVLFTITLVFWLNRVRMRIQRALAPAVIIVTALVLVNFVANMNWDVAIYCPYDKNAKKVYGYLKAAADKREGETTVHANWILTGALYYYQIKDNNKKLNIVSVWPAELATKDTNATIYYVIDTVKTNLPGNAARVLAFPRERTYLLEATASQP